MSCPNTGVWVKIGTFISSPTSSAEGSCSACKKRLPDGCPRHESCSGDVGDSLYIGPEHCRWSTNTLYRESLDIRWDLTGAFRKRVPGSAQLCRGGSFEKKLAIGNQWPIGKFLMDKQWNVEVVRYASESTHTGWDANELTWKNPCTTDWTMPRWIS